jgi:hypothetical protein
MKGIYKILILMAVITTATMLFADWSGFYGYVMHNPGKAASYANVRAWKTGFDDTVQANVDGYYELTCPGGYYTMRAWKGDLSQTKYNQYCTGWGTQVDFMIGDGTPDQGEE